MESTKREKATGATGRTSDRVESNGMVGAIGKEIEVGELSGEE